VSEQPLPLPLKSSIDALVFLPFPSKFPQGDLIPWTVGQQFQDAEFPSLSGARVVRIAVHPELPRAGYGTRCEDSYLILHLFRSSI
jgi:hypothetical protein